MHKTIIETETQKLEIRQVGGHLEIHVKDLIDNEGNGISPLLAMSVYYTPKGETHDFAAYIDGEWVTRMKGEPRHGDGVPE